MKRMLLAATVMLVAACEGMQVPGTQANDDSPSYTQAEVDARVAAALEQAQAPAPEAQAPVPEATPEPPTGGTPDPAANPSAPASAQVEQVSYDLGPNARDCRHVSLYNPPRSMDQEEIVRKTNEILDVICGGATTPLPFPECPSPRRPRETCFTSVDN